MSDDLSRLQAIFQEALTQPRDMWEGFVAEACAGNAALAREVHSLLRASEASKGFYHDLTRRVEAAVSPMIGARLGPWKILSQVGRGGMGTVYKAQRDDGQFRQQVALKTLRVGAADAQAAARFANEQALLARLEHPQIARLIDGGFASDDTPYLVMEYVDGVPLDVWCREQGATLSERLRLFTRVCDAVSYAHRSLVVHRDLKPSNVLVTAAGHPKLLDFGIAKALDGGERGDLTEEGGALMTPRYAAPELLRGATATTLADVYSLGVLLYELLTGNAAYDPGLSLSDLVQQVCVQPLRAPSQRVANRPLARALRGDLDTIVLKATAKDPNERYASVDSLRQDIMRHLANEPVTARGPSLAYRFAKFLRRNALASAFAGIATVALVA
ncbi:MAG: serine/threonine-protein kinase, partial [Pseudomonadota bacterium]